MGEDTKSLNEALALLCRGRDRPRVRPLADEQARSRSLRRGHRRPKLASTRLPIEKDAGGLTVDEKADRAPVSGSIADGGGSGSRDVQRRATESTAVRRAEAPARLAVLALATPDGPRMGAERVLRRPGAGHEDVGEGPALFGRSRRVGGVRRVGWGASRGPCASLREWEDDGEVEGRRGRGGGR